MEIKVTSDRKDVLEFEIKGESHAFAKLLMNQLLKTKNVETAYYKIEHPLLSSPQFYVKVKSGKPRDAVMTALKSISKEIKGLI